MALTVFQVVRQTVIGILIVTSIVVAAITTATKIAETVDPSQGFPVGLFTTESPSNKRHMNRRNHHIRRKELHLNNFQQKHQHQVVDNGQRLQRRNQQEQLDDYTDFCYKSLSKRDREIPLNFINTNEYSKFVDDIVAEYFHNSTNVVRRRQQLRRRQKVQSQQEIELKIMNLNQESESFDELHPIIKNNFYSLCSPLTTSYGNYSCLIYVFGVRTSQIPGEGQAQFLDKVCSDTFDAIDIVYNNSSSSSSSPSQNPTASGTIGTINPSPTPVPSDSSTSSPPTPIPSISLSTLLPTPVPSSETSAPTIEESSSTPSPTSNNKNLGGIIGISASSFIFVIASIVGIYAWKSHERRTNGSKASKKLVLAGNEEDGNSSLSSKEIPIENEKEVYSFPTDERGNVITEDLIYNGDNIESSHNVGVGTKARIDDDLQDGMANLKTNTQLNEENKEGDNTIYANPFKNDITSDDDSSGKGIASPFTFEDTGSDESSGGIFVGDVGIGVESVGDIPASIGESASDTCSANRIPLVHEHNNDSDRCLDVTQLSSGSNSFSSASTGLCPRYNGPNTFASNDSTSKNNDGTSHVLYGEKESVTQPLQNVNTVALPASDSADALHSKQNDNGVDHAAALGAAAGATGALIAGAVAVVRQNEREDDRTISDTDGQSDPLPAETTEKVTTPPGDGSDETKVNQSKTQPLVLPKDTSVSDTTKTNQIEHTVGAGAVGAALVAGAALVPGKSDEDAIAIVRQNEREDDRNISDTDDQSGPLPAETTEETTMPLGDESDTTKANQSQTQALVLPKDSLSDTKKTNQIEHTADAALETRTTFVPDKSDEDARFLKQDESYSREIRQGEEEIWGLNEYNLTGEKDTPIKSKPSYVFKGSNDEWIVPANSSANAVARATGDVVGIDAFAGVNEDGQFDNLIDDKDKNLDSELVFKESENDLLSSADAAATSKVPKQGGSKDPLEFLIEGFGDVTSTTGSGSDTTSSYDSTNNTDMTERYRAEVESIIKEILPEEVDSVDLMMERFNGREDELLLTLHNMKERAILHRARLAVHKSDNRFTTRKRSRSSRGVSSEPSISSSTTSSSVSSAVIAAASVPHENMTGSEPIYESIFNDQSAEEYRPPGYDTLNESEHRYESIIGDTTSSSNESEEETSTGSDDASTSDGELSKDVELPSTEAA